MNSERGFTLVEILVALAVVAVALAALLGASGRATREASELRDRTYAGWVAQNVITELRLSEETLSTGVRRGEEELAGQTWEWTADVSEAAVPMLRHLLVRVRRQGEEGATVTVSAFRLTEPQQRVQQQQVQQP